MMKKEHILPFVKATIDTFTTMVDVAPQQKDIAAIVPPLEQNNVSAMIGLSGDAKGMVGISMSNATALKIVSRFTGEEVTQFGEDVTDAVGELINIIAGGAKAEIHDMRLMISLPSVMHGERYYLSMPKEAPLVAITFTLPDTGDLTLCVSLIPEAG
ncbi:MAG: chemotaxis protein CheX [Myxococcales bacterium]|nr:MAG: chemotaxis protein CheX [Myxococcales bacterium]